MANVNYPEQPPLVVSCLFHSDVVVSLRHIARSRLKSKQKGEKQVLTDGSVCKMCIFWQAVYF